MKKLIYERPSGTTDNRIWNVKIDSGDGCTICVETYIRQKTDEWYTVDGSRLGAVHEFLLEIGFKIHQKNEVQV